MSANGKPVLNAFTVDVEEYFQVSAFEGIIDRSTWDDIESRVAIGTGRILDLFDAHHVKATFFVLGWIADRHPGLVREIHDRGHEIASHGWEHRLVTSFDAASIRADFRRASDAIHAACGVRVDGFRAPSFSFSGETPWAFDVLAREGYTWSSSVFPVRHDRYGIPDFPRWPVRVDAGEGRTLLEFPMTTWRVLGRNLPVAGGGWLRALPPWIIHRALRAANGAGHPAITYVHPWEVDPDQPDVPEAPRKARFRHRLNLKKTLDRIDRLLGAFPFGPVREVLASTAP